MIRANGHDSKGRPITLVGLSAENIRRLKDNKPILADYPDGSRVMVLYGETEDDIMEDLHATRLCSMTILVSLPTYRTPPELLDKAIGSILNQTFTNLVLVVVGDGEEPEIDPVWRRDSRLEVFVLPANRGRYFADAVTQQANPFNWWSQHDADDWSAEHRFNDLWSKRKTGAVWSVLTTNGRLNTLPNALRPLQSRLHGTGYHIGLYSMDRIRAIGGSHPGYRVAYDTMFNILIRMTGDVAMSPRPYYHRHKGPGSLTVSPETGRGSKLRNDSVKALAALHSLVYAAYAKDQFDQIPDIVTRSIPPELRDEVAVQAERLRRRLT